MNHYVYIITNLMNGKKYIGKRSCRCSIEDDKYMGSGLALNRAKKKYGIEWFEKKILLICESEDEAYEEERKAIALVDGINNEMYYNISCGGRGLLSGKTHPSYGRKMPEHQRKFLVENNPMSKRVICLNTGEIFKSINYASRKYGIVSEYISYACKNKVRYAGKLNDGTPLIWKYYDDCIGMTKDYMQQIVVDVINNIKHPGAKSVVCVNTGEVFDSALKASKVKKTNPSYIIKCCKRECDFTGYLSGERLVWRYLEEYDENEDITEILDRGKVVCLNTKEIFDTTYQASNKYNLTSSHVAEVCKNHRRSAGVHPDTGKPMVWMYLTDYKKATKKEIDDRLNVSFGRGRYRKVVCLNTGEVFNTISDVERKYNIKVGSQISGCCKGKMKFAGKHPITKEKLVWRYLEDYEKMTEEEINGIVKNIGKSSDRPVVCLNTGEVFEDIKIAEEKYNISQRSIIRCASGKWYSAGKHPVTKAGLVWMYLDEYEEKYGKLDKEII